MFPNKQQETGEIFKLLKQGESLSLESKFIRPDQSVLYYFTNFSPLFESGKFSGILAMLRDISQEKQLQKELLSFSEIGYHYYSYNLHSELGQLSSAVNFKLEAFKMKVERNQLSLDSLQDVEEIQQINKDLSEKIRSISSLFSDPTLKQIDSGLRDLCRQISHLFRVKCSVDTKTFNQKLEPYQVLHLYRIAQESLLNAIRHGEANSVSLSLATVNQGFKLVIADNGIGFQPSNQGAKNGLGLAMMKYRTLELDAQFQLDSSEQGTIITITQN